MLDRWHHAPVETRENGFDVDERAPPKFTLPNFLQGGRGQVTAGQLPQGGVLLAQRERRQGPARAEERPEIRRTRLTEDGQAHRVGRPPDAGLDGEQTREILGPPAHGGQERALVVRGPPDEPVAGGASKGARVLEVEQSPGVAGVEHPPPEAGDEGPILRAGRLLYLRDDVGAACSSCATCAPAFTSSR